jgi:hypothetical protein
MPRGSFLHYRNSWWRRVRFWVLALLLCGIAAGAALGIKYLLQAVGVAQSTNYSDGVDVPPEKLHRPGETK